MNITATNAPTEVGINMLNTIEDPRTNQNGEWVATKEEMRTVLLKEQGGVCIYCRRMLRVDVATIEHVVPLAQGGWWSKANLAAACHACNNFKGSLSLAEWKRRLLRIVASIDGEDPPPQLGEPENSDFPKSPPAADAFSGCATVSVCLDEGDWKPHGLTVFPLSSSDMKVRSVPPSIACDVALRLNQSFIDDCRPNWAFLVPQRKDRAAVFVSHAANGLPDDPTAWPPGQPTYETALGAELMQRRENAKLLKMYRQLTKWTVLARSLAQVMKACDRSAVGTAVACGE